MKRVLWEKNVLERIADLSTNIAGEAVFITEVEALMPQL